MESLLSDTRLPDEIHAFKATADLLASLKQRYPASYAPPLEERSKRPTLVNVPVCSPPTSAHDNDDDGDAPAPADQSLSLTIKSLKPALAFTLAARPTATIAELKAQLAQAEKDAPAPEQQRWILKGKAMGDGKLLREFGVRDGAVVNLMITKAPAAPAPAAASPSPAASSSSPAVPALTLSDPSTSSAPHPTEVSLARDLDSLPLTTSTSADHPELAGLSPSFLSTVSSPALWQSVREAVEGHFGAEVEAQQVWEAMFSGAREWIRPNDKALVREKVGYSAMGGV
ncbi:hypothetical protein JCM10449v2_004024 [Rhodotorula kratochvilovae]